MCPSFWNRQFSKENVSKVRNIGWPGLAIDDRDLVFIGEGKSKKGIKLEGHKS